ncbi:MAG: hypothetical protein WBN04_13210 [Paracoccaceae bacterium]
MAPLLNWLTFFDAFWDARRAKPGKGIEGFDLTLALDKGWEEHIARMRTSLHGDAD